MFKNIDEQLKIIKRGVLEIVREEELVEKALDHVRKKKSTRNILGD